MVEFLIHDGALCQCVHLGCLLEAHKMTAMRLWQKDRELQSQSE